MKPNKRERSPWSDAVAAQIRAERAASKFTINQMVLESGLSRSTYIRMETGEHVADATEIARICGAIGISLPEFFHRVEARTAPGS